MFVMPRLPAVMATVIYALPPAVRLTSLGIRQVPVVVRLDAAARQDLAVLERLAVPSSRPGTGAAMLGQVATLEFSSGPAVIDRYDRSRNVNFEIELSGTPLGEVTEAAQKLPSLQNLPPGVRQAAIGDAEVKDVAEAKDDSATK
mgnify:CR=1 FL=1